MLLFSCLSLLVASVHARRVEVKGRQLILDGKPSLLRGVCYSPVPINESVYFAPYGDYFTSEYSFIWLRDLPLIKAMGANIVRIYGWLPENDHSAFLVRERHGCLHPPTERHSLLSRTWPHSPPGSGRGERAVPHGDLLHGRCDRGASDDDGAARRCDQRLPTAGDAIRQPPVSIDLEFRQ